jgi:phosphoglycerate dehydrogenase-like enzyme
MPQRATIAILDDDHVTRLARYALAGPGEITTAWARNFFLPQDIDPARVFAIGRRLHETDGVRLIPMSVDAAKGTDASILIFRRGTVDAALIHANPHLKLIQRIGVRPDGIDLDAAAGRGILVSCLPRKTLQYTAEHTILLMLALSKRLIVSDDAVRNARWDPNRLRPEHGVAYNWAGMPGLGGLFGKTIGIIGLGEVGALVAHMIRAFDARVIYANRKRLPADYERKLGIEHASMTELLARSDFVSLHASNLPENKAMVDAAFFAKMKPTAFFINTSRGGMVDEDALYAALTKETIAGAGLDVHVQEPRPQPDRFASLHTVVMTPHVAGGPRIGVLDELEEIFDNCRAVLAGQPLKHLVMQA